MNTGSPCEIKYPPKGKSLRTRLRFRSFSTSAAAAGDWIAGGENLRLAASAQVETQRTTASAAAKAAIKGIATIDRAAPRNSSCDDTGVITTSGISKAKISTFRTCESARCSKPKIGRAHV